ncbi:motility associated factor glycosyltransferase family protein [Paenibacillus sp. NFR01]|uniref:motility associated factor glycosyltransferase family protein n=1 Tax=Paenibacillus sp. NFR01 TaxID=1566279 RepID=UPI000AED33F9|nr:6-hydroxymethylpterin diphosphokinase MptE-like protein [Paenibacillus sp. NFR01]
MDKGHSPLTETVQVVDTPVNVPTLKIMQDQRSFFVHSKYHPLEEAETFVQSFGDEITAKHIFFYGMGMGYHIEAFMMKHPECSFSIYEPRYEIFETYLSHCCLDNLPLSQLKNIYIEDGIGSTPIYVDHFIKNVKEETLLVFYPAYERIYKEQAELFHQLFKQGVANKRQSLAINASYQERWTYNSLMNFRPVLQTPNAVRNLKPYFEGTTVILAAAGPSLQDEFENLRTIKQQGLAYIFAVGSANKALISEGIMPDAICSYDPTPLNQRVFQDIVEQGIDSIPLFFGSSVGFEVVRDYPGPKLHMFINQDTISPFYLKGQLNDDEILSDAPSIAVVTLELMRNLGCRSVALVGQNFGYRDNRIYSSGIVYKDIPAELTEAAKAELIWVPGTDGENVATHASHNSAREQMEMYIKRFSSLEVLNSTKGGASIAGAPFKPLEEIMEERMAGRVVAENWLEQAKLSYDIAGVQKQARTMKQANLDFQYTIEAMVKLFKKMGESIEVSDERQLEKIFAKFDKKLQQFTANKFYEVFILPMVRVHLEILQKSTNDIRSISNLVDRGKQALDAYGRYIYECRQCWYQIESPYNELQQELLKED